MGDSAVLIAAAVFAFLFLAPSTLMLRCSGLVKELRLYFHIAVPGALRMLFFTLSDSIFVALVGHMDSVPTAHFDGVVQGMMLSNITGLSLGIGFASALAPFVAQDFGMGFTNRSGLHLRNFVKGAVFIFGITVLVAVEAKQIMGFLGQDPDVSACVQTYARINVASLPAQLFVKAVQQILESQRDVVPGLVVDVVGAVSQPPLTYIVLSAGMGYRGAAAARVVVNNSIAIILFVWVAVSKRGSRVWVIQKDERTAEGADASMSAYLGQAIPSTIACCIEWWAQELMLVVAGVLPRAPLAVAGQGILFNSAVIFYMVWIGAKNAIGVRVGNLIGSDEPSKIPQAIAVTLAASTFEVFLVVTFGWIYRFQIISFFTVNAEVVDVVAESWSWMLYCMVPYSFTFILAGVLTGAGKQSAFALVYFICFIIGLPTGAYLAVCGALGLSGVWIGNSLFFVIATCFLYVIVLKCDWKSMQASKDDYVKIEHAYSPQLIENLYSPRIERQYSPSA